MNLFSVKDCREIQGNLNLSPRKADPKKRSFNGRTYSYENPKPESECLAQILISPTKRRQVESAPTLRSIPFVLDDQDGNSTKTEIKYVEGPKTNVGPYMEDFQVPYFEPRGILPTKAVDRRHCPLLTEEERTLLDKLETRVPLTEEELTKVGIDLTKQIPEEEFQHLLPIYNRHIEDDENHPFVMARFIQTHAYSMIQYAVSVNKAVMYPKETTQLPFSLLVSPENTGMVCILLNSKGIDRRTFSGGFKIGKLGIDAATGVKYVFLSSRLDVPKTVRHGLENEYRSIDELTSQAFANCLFPAFCYEYPTKSKGNLWEATIPTKVGFATRFISGGDLGKAIVKKKVFSINEICCIARGILNGLASLHNKGRLHLDVNPNNVLLDIVKGNIVDVFLCDWGNMQSIGNWTNFCTHLHFASPEWLYELTTCVAKGTFPTIFVDEWDEGRKYDAYSAGLTLHMLLNSISTEMVPWLPQDQSTEYLRDHVFESIETREEWHRQLPESDPLQRIVKGLTHPDPRVRTRVDQALEDLITFMDCI